MVTDPILLGDFGWWVWGGLLVAVVLATILQVGAGVGFGSVAGPSAMLLAPPLMPGAILCVSLAASVLGAGRIQGRIAYREVALALVGRSAGAAVAGWMVARLGAKDVFGLIFAGLTLLGVLMSMSGLKLSTSPATLLGAGFLSGLMATVTTIGGPPMALVYQSQPIEKARPTLNAFFAIGIVPPILALWFAGAVDGLALGRAALLLPAVVIGVALSHFATAFIGRRYRVILLSFCIAAAIIIAVRALMKMFM